MIQGIENPVEDIRAIRRLMERSSRYTNFSASSCLWAGVGSLAGAMVQAVVAPKGATLGEFLAVWGATIAGVLLGDLLITRRRITTEDKAVLVRLGRQMAASVTPALVAGAALTYLSLAAGRFAEIYPIWILVYGVVICAASSSSPRELSWFGRTFLAIGVAAVVLHTGFGLGERFGLAAFALAFGLCHVVYGLLLARREGW